MNRSDARAPARRIPGNALFFPVATAYSIFVLPASVFSMLGFTNAFPGLVSPAGHAHEMLFGFALAVVAGNQLGPRTPRALALALILWLGARATFLFLPGSPLDIAANIAFPALLALYLAPRLFGSAKKWRNQALPAVLTAICASAVALTLALLPPVVALTSQRVAMVAVALFALLLLFMGGRMIAPAVAGQFYRQGHDLAARVQPRIEGALIIVMALAVTALALDSRATAGGRALASDVAGAALIVAGLLAAFRLARWRVWALRGRPDLVCLAVGYAWLALGLVLLGSARAWAGTGPRGETLALHVITIGSLGTLTLNVMAMTRLLKVRRDPASTPLPLLGTLLLGAATVLRVVAGYVSDARLPLTIAALCWSAAFVLLLVLLLHPHRRPR
jgi:uncharacterized protein involved in response to NO